MIPFADPAPSRPPEGLQRERCKGCGALALADAQYVGAIHCSGCWAAIHGAHAAGELWSRAARRFPGGGRPAPASAKSSHNPNGGQTRVRGVVALPSGAGRPAAYRVLIPRPPDTRNPPASASQIPPGATAVLVAAGAAGLEASATYALAEELATGRLVHSVAVRVAGRGFGTWVDRSFSGAMWRGVPRVHGQGHLLALVAGELWTPPAPRAAPPTGPCPRCRAAVRWKIDPKTGTPSTWKHNRAAAGEGERATKVTCE